MSKPITNAAVAQRRSFGRDSIRSRQYEAAKTPRLRNASASQFGAAASLIERMK